MEGACDANKATQEARSGWVPCPFNGSGPDCHVGPSGQ
jgi:hypothetical protein